MPSWGNIVAHVVRGAVVCDSDGEVDLDIIPEYDVQLRHEDGIPCVSCWVPSTANEPFTIWWIDNTLPRTASRGDVSIDGVELPDYYFIHPSRGRYSDNCPNAYVNQAMSEDGLRQLVFAPVVLSDDDNVGSASALLGEFHILLSRISITGRSNKQEDVNMQPFTIQPVVHEQSKKAGSHSVQFGSAIESYPEFGLDYKEIGPLVKFTFRYRPLEILKAKGIVPREAMPVEIATDSEADSDMEPPAQAPSPESASPPPMAMQRYLNSSPRTATNDLPEGGIKTEEDQRKLDLEQLRERKKRLDAESRKAGEEIARLEGVNGVSSSSDQPSLNFKRELDPQLKIETSPRRRSKKVKTWQPPNPDDIICID